MKPSFTSLPLAALLLLPTTTAVETLVDLSYSKYQGVALGNGVSQWLGMRFAVPPVGPLRFMPPEDPVRTTEVQKADKHGKYCLGTKANPNDTKTAEDCLFLDVQAPSNATSTSKLPVFLFIQGGGFNTNSNPNLNASSLLQASELGIVVVTFNYRVGPYGFLADDKDILPNNGLRDQVRAMEWVQQHISRFGGDPDHVVLGGSSAGAASVVLHMTSSTMTGNGTRNSTRSSSSSSSSRQKPLFHAVSAGSPSFATMFTPSESAYQYRLLATRLGCVGNNGLSCLRNKTAAEVQAQNINVPLPGAASPPNFMYTPVIDGDLVPDYTYRLLEQGKFVKIPAIFGDDTNGGTLFVPQNTSTLAESNRYILDQYPFLSLPQLGELNDLYPNPNKNSSCSDSKGGCYWRQASNVYGEGRYMCPARAITAALSRSGVEKSYAYRWNVEDPELDRLGLGVPHTIEMSALWGPDYPAGKTPASYKEGGENEAATPVLQRYMVNFIRTFDPNSGGGKGGGLNDTQTTRWKPWSVGEQSRLTFGVGGNTEMEPFGDALNKRCDFWAKNGVVLRT